MEFKVLVNSYKGSQPKSSEHFGMGLEPKWAGIHCPKQKESTPQNFLVNKPMEEKAFPTAGPLNSTLARQLQRAIKL